MPCAGVHLHLADVLLRHWREEPHRSPLDPDSPAERQAFLHGAMGPDLGFVPGGERLLSELSHYLRTADLTRALLARARTAQEQAFAWGWVSHVEGDVALHPQVGRSVGEWIFGDRTRRMDAAEDEVRHVGMEVGLDLELLRRGWVPDPPGESTLASQVASLLSEAFKEVHDVVWEPELLRRLQFRAARLVRLWPAALDRLARGRRGGDSWFWGSAVRMAPRIPGLSTAVRGFFQPLNPPEWLLGEVATVARGFPDRMDRLVASNAAEMENRHLETGQMESDSEDHPGTRSALRGLARLRGR